MNRRTRAVWRTFLAVAACVAAAEGITSARDAAPTSSPAEPADAAVARGRYLVSSVGCHDCHTPFHMGPDGPEPDMSRMLSGHPQDHVMPPAPRLPEGPWAGVFSDTSTAWAGAWGVSFTANLTPDEESGLGRWTERNFVEAIRTGRHMGRGRPILPPMPWQMLKNLTDEDLKAIFAYLRTIPPIRNQVPEPVPPDTTSGD